MALKQDEHVVVCHCVSQLQGFCNIWWTDLAGDHIAPVFLLGYLLCRQWRDKLLLFWQNMMKTILQCILHRKNCSWCKIDCLWLLIKLELCHIGKLLNVFMLTRKCAVFAVRILVGNANMRMHPHKGNVPQKTAGTYFIPAGGRIRKTSDARNIYGLPDPCRVLLNSFSVPCAVWKSGGWVSSPSRYMS